MLTLLLMLAFSATAANTVHGQATDRTTSTDEPGRVVTIPITGDRLSGFVLPIEPLSGPFVIRALRADVWTIDDTQRFLLDRDVEIEIAGHRFRAPSGQGAVVWLNRIPSQWGTINQIAVYFDEVMNPTRQAGVGVAGRNVLVTGSTIGDVELLVTRLERQRPSVTGLMRRGEARLTEYLRRIAGDPPPLAQWPQVKRPPDAPEPFRPIPGRRFEPEAVELPEVVELPAPEPTPWLVPPTGTVRYSAAEVQIVPGVRENSITMIGPIVVEYISGDRGERWQRITITSERGVIFTDPGPIEAFVTGQLTAQSVRGVYLEGNVIIRADEDDYTVRSPQVYYDFRTDRAIMVDAILRTYSREQGLLVYSRAQELRQLSESQWEARQVQVSTSEFFTPHISVGARRATITQRPSRTDPQRTETHLDTRDVTLRAGNVPFFYWPRFSGTLRDTPLRSVVLSTRRNDGVRVETTWNALSLLGIDPPPGLAADLKLDGFSKRGAGVGTEIRYREHGTQGNVDLYGLWDDGIDRAATGVNVDSGRELRGLALWEHQARFGRDWTFQGQASWISDPTFVSHWREDDFRTRREYETSAYLKHQKDNAALTVLGKYEVNDFISNDYLIASQQYQVEKLPELTYRRYGDSLFFDHVTYHSESRLTRMRMMFNAVTPREIGLPSSALDIDQDDRIDEMLRARGMHQSNVLRADTRHELSIPFDLGIFQIVPFVVGRVTAYDDDFDTFSSDAEKLRFFGSTGITVGTRFQHVNNRVNSRVFDLHRLRHIVEPSMTVWYGYSNVPSASLPVYDAEVEALAEGAAMRFGVKNTWQTQRGGPGRWRSVDVLTLDTHLVMHSSDADRVSPTPQFFDYRPEYSQPGDHVAGTALWQMSDAVTFAAHGTYDLDFNVLARGSVGAELRHTPVFSTYVEYRVIEASRSQLLDVGWAYQLTPKYHVRISPQWDFREDQLRSITLRLTRQFPDINLIFFVNFDRIRDETNVGATLGLVQF
jgi:hypothetical protein